MQKIYPSQLSGQISLETAINQGKLLEGVLSVREAGFDSKTFHSWKMSGILSSIPTGQWAELSFIDILWVRTLESMRRFGCSLNTMKMLHEGLFVRAYKENLGKKTLKENVAFLKQLSLQRPLTEEESSFLSNIKTNLADPLLNSKDLGITYFSQLVIKCFTQKSEVGIIIFENNSYQTFVVSTEKNSETIQIDLSVPHIKIPISHFIKEFVADEERETFLQPLGVLNENEYTVLKEIRNKNVRSITISFSDAAHKIEKIETTKSGLLKEEQAKQIKEILGLKNYQSIELYTRDGKNLSFKKTKKTIMST